MRKHARLNARTRRAARDAFISEAPKKNIIFEGFRLIVRALVTLALVSIAVAGLLVYGIFQLIG